MNESTGKQMKLRNVLPTEKRRRARVRLKRVNSNTAIACPPLEEARLEWWERLKAALGNCSSEFAYVSLQQLIECCRLPRSGISEVAVNAAIAFIEGAHPRDEVEATLLIQAAATHSATMAVLGRAGGPYGGERSLTASTNAASRMLRAYATHVEALRRWRNGGTQVVRIEHVHINEGGQAIVGAVAHR